MQGTYPVNIDVTSPPQVARWRPLINWLLVLPQSIWLLILLIVAELASIVAWFAIVFTGSLPDGLGNFIAGVLRYSWRVEAYLYAWTEVYPSFSLPSGYSDPGDYPAVFYSAPEPQRNRLTVLLRIIWAIPQLVVLYFVRIAASVVLLLAWFAVLFTGRWPEGMRNFCIGYMRWEIRVLAYLFLLTDVYPPFRLEA